jgi:hypothetical protein
MKSLWTLPFFFLLIFLTSCRGVVEPVVSSPPQPDPEPGKTTVVGHLVSSAGDPVPNMLVRLAEVVRQGDEGAFVLDGAFSPGATTDENGFFAMENIFPREYVIVIGDVLFEYEVVSEPQGGARTWVAAEDQVLDVGAIRVTIWP